MAKKQGSGEGLSWLLIVGLYIVGLWPIGLVLLLVKLFAADNKKTAGGQTAANTAARQNEDAGRHGAAARAAKSVTRQPKAKRGTAWVLQIVGGILAFFALVGGGDYIGWFLSGNFYWFGEVLRVLATTAAGAGMFAAGWGMKAAMKRYPRYAAVIGQRAIVPAEEVSRKLGYSLGQVERDLRKMLEDGVFGPEAYFDVEKGTFFRSARDEEEMSRQQKEEEKAKSLAKKEEGFSGILRQLRRADERIDDEEVSAQICRLEAISARIFRAVEEDPAKKKHIDRLLDYYLPTTQKLLDSYAEFEAAGIEGENLRQAKESIRKTMDSIVRGFEHQLDELYRMDAMDVDKDIRVMETMLRRDTASVSEDFGLGGTAVQTEEE